MVEEINMLVRTSIPRNVDVRLELADRLPSVEGDAVQIQQLVMNLVINGAEAVGAGRAGPRLHPNRRVRARNRGARHAERRDAAGRTLRLRAGEQKAFPTKLN